MRHEHHAPPRPVLRFTPTAWAKLLYFRDRKGTEVGGFGITSIDDPLLVEDFVTVKQDVTAVSIAFDDEAVADYFEDQVDLGRRPEQFCRIWLHTHPGHSPQPSDTDEATFSRVFGKCQWAVMFILARGGESFARLRFNVGPSGHAVVPVEIDYGQEFEGSDADAWEVEYEANVYAGKEHFSGLAFGFDDEDDMASGAYPSDWLTDLESMEPEERQLVLTELSARSDLWEETENTDEFI